jgi:predicted ATP-dependent protease
MTKFQELSPEELRFHCDERLFDFETTETVTPLELMIGQERAVKAVDFGLLAKGHGYNIFMSGLVGTGKITYAKGAVYRTAAKQAVPNDLCYVNNFDNTSQPIALSLPPGIGNSLRQDMQELIEDLKTEIPKVFSSDDYEEAKTETAKKFQVQRADIMEAFNQQAEENGVLPQWTTTGFVGLPIVNNKPLTPEEYKKLDKEEREVIEKKLIATHEKAMESVRRMQAIEREVREELKDLDVRVGLFAAGHLIDEIKNKYSEYEQVVQYLETVKQDVVKNINDFKPAQADEEQNPFLMFKKNLQDAAKDKYKVNVLVDNSNTEGAPVIIEINPTYYNLIGRVEYETRMGMVLPWYSRY